MGGQGRRDDDKWNGDYEFDDGHGEKQMVIPLNEEMIIPEEEAILMETWDKKEMIVYEQIMTTRLHPVEIS